MLDSLTSNNWRDFRQRYVGTYGFFPTESGKKILVKVADAGQQQTTFIDKDHVIYHTYANKGTLLEFIQVERGWYNTPEGAVLLSRIPARQWQRGISDANTAMFVCKNTIIKRGLDFTTLDNIFSHPISLQDALVNRHTKKVVSVALNKRFAVSGSDTLYLYQRIVGQFSIKNQSIEIHDPLFKQEIQDMNVRLGFFYQIK